MAEFLKVIFKHYHLVLMVLTILLALSIYNPDIVSPAVVATFTVGFLLGILYERFEREDC